MLLPRTAHSCPGTPAHCVRYAEEPTVVPVTVSRQAPLSALMNTAFDGKAVLLLLAHGTQPPEMQHRPAQHCDSGPQLAEGTHRVDAVVPQGGRVPGGLGGTGGSGGGSGGGGGAGGGGRGLGGGGGVGGLR